jgi:hypothetical protein
LTIEAVDVSVSGPTSVRGFRFRLAAVNATVDGAQRTVAIPASASWQTEDQVFADGTTTRAPRGEIGFDRSAIVGNDIGAVTTRIVPAGPTRASVVISRPFATATGLAIGNKISVDGQLASFAGVVTGIAPNVPGAPNGSSMIAGLSDLQRAWLASSEQIPASTELWIASDTPGLTAQRVAKAIPSARVTLATSNGGGEVIRPAEVALWLGTLGAGAFASIALVAAALALLRRRAVETAALRALGVTAKRQASRRQDELWIVAGAALVIGAIVGVAVTLLVAPTMARLSTPAAPPALPLAISFDPAPLLITLAVLAIVSVACTLTYGMYVRRQGEGR